MGSASRAMISKTHKGSPSSSPRSAAATRSHSASSSSRPAPEPQQCPPSSSQTAHTIYPPILPPPDFFDLELEAEKLKDMFKVSNSLKNPLYDETGLVKLPADEKGNLILDPESRTRMVDVEVEFGVLYEYLEWMKDVKEEVEGFGGPPGGGEGRKWLEGLREAVNEDFGEVFDEWHEVVDEERGKRGLTDRWTHWGSYKGQTYDAEKQKWNVVTRKEDEREAQEETDTLSRSPTLVESAHGEQTPVDQGRLHGTAPQNEDETLRPGLSQEDVVEEEQTFRETSGCIIKEDEDQLLSKSADLAANEASGASEATSGECVEITPQIDLVTLWW